MSFAPTLGEALADFVSFQIDNSRGAAAYLHRMGDDFALGFGVYDPDFRSSHAGYDLALTVGCNMIRKLTDGQVEARGNPHDATANPPILRPIGSWPDAQCASTNRSAASFSRPAACNSG